jgi:putative methionine-R-sulfoxide reductase with GAF domain
VRAVLDVDSDFPDIFDTVDQAALELLADDVSIVFSGKSHH